jgi:hypothetical protein
MKIIELVLDEENEDSGITAISVVENPAIEEDFIALKNQQYSFAEQDKEKRLLIGAALVPNKPIFRKSGDKEEDEYYIFFSKETVRKASELFFIKGNQSKSTLEHSVDLDKMTVVESWIVESEIDKSRQYGLNVPIGTWMVSMKVNNDEVWNEYVKEGKVKGFSVEAYFSDKMARPKDKSLSEDLKQLEAEIAIEEVLEILNEETNLESYNDYPKSIVNNAKRGIEMNKKNGNKCATQVGKVRASTLAKRGKITLQTIKRMYSYLSRAEAYYDPNDSKACGTISYLLWGGKAALGWSRNKLRELGELEEEMKKPCEPGYEMIGFKMKNGRRVPNCVPLSKEVLVTEVVNDQFAIIDDRLAYSTKEKAQEMASNIGCAGFHVHNLDGKDWYMPCKQHSVSDEEFRKYKCPKGYKKDYKKHKCVKMTEDAKKI